MRIPTGPVMRAAFVCVPLNYSRLFHDATSISVVSMLVVSHVPIVVVLFELAYG